MRSLPKHAAQAWGVRPRQRRIIGGGHIRSPGRSPTLPLPPPVPLASHIRIRIRIRIRILSSP